MRHYIWFSDSRSSNRERMLHQTESDCQQLPLVFVGRTYTPQISRRRLRPLMVCLEGTLHPQILNRLHSSSNIRGAVVSDLRGGTHMNIDNFQVLTPDGAATTLGKHRAGRAGIMVFVRHFGCIFCRQRIAELVQQTHQFKDTDLAVWVVGNGTAAMANDFINTHVSIAIFTDPSRRIYRELGMKRKIGLG